MPYKDVKKINLLYFRNTLNFNQTYRQEIFEHGAFGGTYWRPIHSSVTNKTYKNQHKKFDFLKNIPSDMMTRDYESDYNKDINKYKVKVGMTLKEWKKIGLRRRSIWMDPMVL